MRTDRLSTGRATDPTMARYGVFKPTKVAVRPEQILRVHGYKDRARVRPVILAAAETIGQQAQSLFTPEIHYRRLAVRVLDDDGLILDGGLVFRSEAFAHFLTGAREVVVAIATMGAALDREVIAHMERFEPLDALFLETAGWLGIENMTKQFGGVLRDWAQAEGYRVTCRLGPGYGYRISGRSITWSLEEQERIFAAFEGIPLPVTLLPSCVMLPKMSRTGIFGFVPVH